MPLSSLDNWFNEIMVGALASTGTAGRAIIKYIKRKFDKLEKEIEELREKKQELREDNKNLEVENAVIKERNLIMRDRLEKKSTKSRGRNKDND